MRKYKQEIIWQEIEQSINNLLRLGILEHEEYDAARHEMRRAVRAAMERISAREELERRKLNTQIHNNEKDGNY